MQTASSLFTTDTFLDLYQGRKDAISVLGANRWHCVRPENGELRQVIDGHVKGTAQAAVYPLLNDGTVRFAVIDIDAHGDASEDLISVCHVLAFHLADRLRADGLLSYVSRSKSGGGNLHVEIFFTGPAPAVSVRRYLKTIVENRLAWLRSKGNSTPSVEIVPKRDRLRDGSIGSSITLPHFPPCVARDTTVFIDREYNTYTPFVEKNDPAIIDRLVERLPASVREPSRPTLDTSTLFDPVSQGERHNRLLQIVGHLKGKRHPKPEVLALAVQWNSGNHPPLKEGEVCQVVEDLFGKSGGESPDQIRLTQDGLAQRFADKYRDELHFDHSSDQWLRWDGRIWRRDLKNEAMELARGLVRSLYAEASTMQNAVYGAALAKHAAQASTEAALRAMLKLSSSDPRLALTGSELDMQPDLVNFANGTFDLSTCALRSFNPSDLLTQIIEVDYGPEAKCPYWESFIAEVTCQRPTLARYIQRVFGYCLSGRTDAQAAFFGFGYGKNGKTTTVEFLLRLWGPYATRLPVESFLMKKFDNSIPSDIMRLRDKRLVLLSEIPPGKKLDVGRVKDVSGGDTLAARPLYGSWVTFRPIAKLFFQGNHRPHIPDSTQAIWRRLKLIPFDYVVPEDKRIEQSTLFERFWKEREGIVHWLIEGWQGYLAEGLKDVPEVAAASLEYRHEEDAVGEFIDARLEAIQGAELDSREIHQDYTQWATENERPSLSPRLFHLSMAEHGYQFEKRGSRTRTYVGLRFREVSSSALSTPSTPKADKVS